MNTTLNRQQQPITLNLISNTSKHNFLIDQIKKQIETTEQHSFGWLKNNNGLCDNEFANKLVKEAARDKQIIGVSRNTKVGLYM